MAMMDDERVKGATRLGKSTSKGRGGKSTVPTVRGVAKMIEAELSPEVDQRIESLYEKYKGVSTEDMLKLLGEEEGSWVRRAYANRVLWTRLTMSPKWRRSGDDDRHALYQLWRCAVKADW